ncbi:hypothetical protein HZA99_01805 [Candidatus Woesearchaeota archaeon]|nr:hypothetical protein [Candidatus Woesearchaeota archaeon]
MMQKRGQLSNQVIIEIVLLVFIAAGFFYFHMTVQENTLFEKSYASRDIALLLETSQSVPGDIQVYYSQPTFDVGKYSYSFTDNLLQIYEPGNPVSAIYYPFYVDHSLQNFLSTFEQPPAFLISKQKGNLEVLEHGAIIEEKQQAIPCLNVASTKKEKLSMVVLADTALAKIQTDLLNNPKIDFAKKNKEESAISDRTNLVLMLSSGSGSGVSFSIPATDDGQSEKLACLIANSLIEKFPDTSISSPLKSNDALLSKNKNGLAVGIVIGTDVAGSNSVSSALTTGLEGYYE